MLYTFQVCQADSPDPHNRQWWMRIGSQSHTSATGKPFVDANYHLGLRLRDHLERKGHTVLWFCPRI